MIPRYRAWDTDEKKMGTVVTLGWDRLGLKINEVQVIFEGSGSDLEYYHDAGIEAFLVLMQSPGLPDKNNMIIFEGDWVKYYRDAASSCLYGNIQLIAGCFEIHWKDKKFGAMISALRDYHKALEIIGNIHVTPNWEELKAPMAGDKGEKL